MFSENCVEGIFVPHHKWDLLFNFSVHRGFPFIPGVHGCSWVFLLTYRRENLSVCMNIREVVEARRPDPGYLRENCRSRWPRIHPDGPRLCTTSAFADRWLAESPRWSHALLSCLWILNQLSKSGRKIKQVIVVIHSGRIEPKFSSKSHGPEISAGEEVPEPSRFPVHCDIQKRDMKCSIVNWLSVAKGSLEPNI